ncbi:MAG: histone deacetylase family protein [Desulfarculaceae bacterium]|nr:histone deacetylase family protein [Desulfarculaceae bacterium]MCF8047107.1 histone deacetylase family protein [Desulfarculaceae bacterium]MCF8098110.1 histone deacetylase family protein [Desulfarculaceae bacterium]MCF8122958.1 histone deacetylase family protein [Desulfarculaceae bacterium]
MFRIRRIYDDLRAVDREAVEQVLLILAGQFPDAPASDTQKLSERLRDALTHRLRYVLLVAEEHRRKVLGFALTAYAPDVKFCYLDYLATSRRLTGGGVGGALYQQVRREAARLEAVGLFMECLPDDPALCPDGEMLKQNRSRLKFYERFGARPIAGTAYETPVSPDDDCAPYLVYDPLDRPPELSRQSARRVVRAILERKYGQLCPPSYVKMVVGSFNDDPVRLRPPRYLPAQLPVPKPRGRGLAVIPLVVNRDHAIHHVRERGYVEAPARIGAILKELARTNLFEPIPAHRYSHDHILAVHDPRFFNYLKKMCGQLKPGESVYPYVFPIRNAARPPKDMPVRAGYYCIDTFTPLNRNAYHAARRAVDCALTAAETILNGYRAAYALVRPPGHHAERKVFGGFCYFNSAAVAAHYLSAHGKVAVVDVDYHHGNGTQDIFYLRGDVFTASIHGHPSFAYPYFSGFAEETGEGPGQGANYNLPLPEQVDGEAYAKALAKVLAKVKRYNPDFLVVCLGLDPAKGDPTGSWSLKAADFQTNGLMLGQMGVPTLVVQEGGYYIRSLGTNARNFFNGLARGVGLI